MNRKAAAAATGSSAAHTPPPPLLDKNAYFQNQLSAKLKSLGGVTLIRAEFGRQTTGRFWLLTIELPNHEILSLRAMLEDSELDPFTEFVAEDVGARVLAHLKIG